MKDPINLPHIAPLKFAKHIIEKAPKRARVYVAFEEIPSLPMLVEAAAQSSAAYRENDSESAYLVSLKDVSLVQAPSQMEFEVEIFDEHRMERLRYIRFDVYEIDKIIADGTYVIAVQ